MAPKNLLRNSYGCYFVRFLRVYTGALILMKLFSVVLHFVRSEGRLDDGRGVLYGCVFPWTRSLVRYFELRSY